MNNMIIAKLLGIIYNHEWLLPYIKFYAPIIICQLRKVTLDKSIQMLSCWHKSCQWIRLLEEKAKARKNWTHFFKVYLGKLFKWVIVWLFLNVTWEKFSAI
jgi:hypothetical protein